MFGSLWDDAEVIAELNAIREDRPQTLSFRRREREGSLSLVVRVERTRTARQESSDTASDVHMPIVILAEANADIAEDDRFVFENSLYKVIQTRPHGDLGLRVEAEKVNAGSE